MTGISLDSVMSASALRVLGRAHSDIANAEKRLSTGKKVADARDDGATYMIANRIKMKVAEQSVIQQNQWRANSLLDVTQTAVSQVSDVLSQMREKALALTDTSLDTVSRSAIQANINNLGSQIDQVVDNAGFNGINLLKSTTAPINVGSPVVGYHNLISGSFTVNVGNVEGDLNMNFSYHNATMAWLQLNYGDGSQPYVWATNVGPNFVHHYAASSGSYTVNYDLASTASSSNPGDGVTLAQPTFTSSHQKTAIAVNPDGSALPIEHTDMSAAHLGVANLASVPPDQALAAIDTAIRTTSTGANYYGSQQNLIDGLITSTNKAIDTYQKAYGDLTDADMAKESANLQATQTRAALAAQALNITNQNPKLLLDLFRQ